ncbi:hypothetical protein RND81_02G196900 [Saponaria officinalis]|uniref:Response regulatory domain-containing protein n=1 Tax=Saponaria officinalis TaxID=3572 RepID=A0AAW1MWW4_SAPOF
MTTSMTSIGVPDVALSMMRERGNAYDLIVAATNLQGIDCLSFLKNLMILSDTPIVLISYETDFQLATKTLQEGVCHFLEKPLKIHEARALWQFVFRKPKKQSLFRPKKVLNNDPKQNKNIATNYKDKGKQIVVQSHKRKLLEDGDGDDNNNNYSIIAQISNYRNNITQTDERLNNKKVDVSDDNIKWNPQLHEKFMKVLTTNTQQGAEALVTPDLTMMKMPPKTAYHPQNSYMNINNHIINSTTTISGTDNLNERRQVQPMRYQDYKNPSSVIGINSGPHVDNNLQNSGTTLLRPQSHYLSNNSNNFQINNTNFFNQECTRPQFNTTNCGATNAPYYSTSSGKFYGDFMPQGLSSGTQSEIFGLDKMNVGSDSGQSHIRIGEVVNTQQNNFGSSELMFNLKGRIDQIRREYWTKGKTGINETKDMSNGYVVSNQEQPSNDNLQNENEKQTNVSSGTIIPEFEDTNLDDFDFFLDDIFAELRDDFADDSWKNLGFNASDNMQCGGS